MQDDSGIQECIERYLRTRAEHIRAWKEEGRMIPFCEMEICWLEAGEILFELLGLPGLPTAEEVGEPGKRKIASRHKDQPAKQGFVYLLKNQRNGYTKIGWSSNPHYREMTLQSEEPDITMLANKPGTVKAEKELHARFSACRLRGEWFNLSEQQLGELLHEFAPASPHRRVYEGELQC